tara:strand:- start:86253 stop:86807 length:555 start_codon:yes stop_codon:yes gene_type:complete
MKLFEMKNWSLTVSEEAWGLVPFKKILDRDKSKDKSRALAEVLFVWFWSDIKSDYRIMEPEIRLEELKKDIANLPNKFVIDDIIQGAIDCYEKHKTIIQKLHEKSLVSANDVGNYLENTKALLEERDNQGRPIIKIADITRGLKDVKIIMKELKETEKEVIKEQHDTSGKKKGSKEMNIFEDGL